MTHDAEMAPEVPEGARLVGGLKASIERILGPSVHPDCSAVIDVTMKIVGKLIGDRAAARQRVAELEGERDRLRTELADTRQQLDGIRHAVSAMLPAHDEPGTPDPGDYWRRVHHALVTEVAWIIAPQDFSERERRLRENRSNDPTATDTPREHRLCPTPIEVINADETAGTIRIVVVGWDVDRTIVLPLAQFAAETGLGAEDLVRAQWLEASVNIYAASPEDLRFQNITVAPPMPAGFTGVDATEARTDAKATDLDALAASLTATATALDQHIARRRDRRTAERFLAAREGACGPGAI